MALLISGVFLAMIVVGHSVYSAMAAEEELFCYKRAECGPTTWGGMCQTGTNQSPIDIPVKSRDLYYAKGTDLYLSECYFRPQNFDVTNDGHTADVQVDGASNCFITGGLLPDTYKLGELHFHWGSGDRGSEHAINGRKFAMELHLVHYKAKYSNVSEAQESRDRTAVTVLTTFFQLNDNDNPALDPVIRTLGSVEKAESKTRGRNLVLSNLLPFSRRRNIPVYQYEGSLTTPPCAETVLWSVFDPLTFISKSQLMALRSIRDKNGDALTENSRPPQPLNSRTITYLMSSVRD